MTQAEFNKLQKKSISDFYNLSIEQSEGLRDLYNQAANEISEILKNLDTSNGSLTVKALQDLELALERQGSVIAQSIENNIIEGINYTPSIISLPPKEFTLSALDLSNVNKIVPSLVEAGYDAINEKLIKLTYSRIHSDGYSFSNRIWGAPGKIGYPEAWENAMKSVIETGFAQGRSIFNIADDIKVYVQSGKESLIKRYGGKELTLEVRKLMNGIPKSAEFNSIRLLKSELYTSVQGSQQLAGELSPATEYYIWNLSSTGDFGCVCPDLAADSPYKKNEIPNYPHSNCQCYITLQLRGRDEFINDLIKWDNGESVSYLDDWYENTYQYLPDLGFYTEE